MKRGIQPPTVQAKAKLKVMIAILDRAEIIGLSQDDKELYLNAKAALRKWADAPLQTPTE